MAGPIPGEAFLADQHEAGQPCGQPIGDAALQQHVRFGDRTAIRLPADVMAPGNELREARRHQRAGPIEQIHVIAHAASRRFTAVWRRNWRANWSRLAAHRLGLGGWRRWSRTQSAVSLRLLTSSAALAIWWA